MKKIIFLILCFLSALAIAEESGVKVDKDVEKFLTVYCEYWSDGDYKKIISEIYDTPFTPVSYTHLTLPTTPYV